MLRSQRAKTHPKQQQQQLQLQSHKYLKSPKTRTKSRSLKLKKNQRRLLSTSADPIDATTNTTITTPPTLNLESPAVITNAGAEPNSSHPEQPLNRLLAKTGKVSRRTAATLIKESKVFLNGELVTNPAHRPWPEDLVKVLESQYSAAFEIRIKDIMDQIEGGKNLLYGGDDGQSNTLIGNLKDFDPNAPNPKHIVIVLNKPPGYVCSKPMIKSGTPTVYDLLPANLQCLNYAGRLDQHSSGFLLFTNHGDLIHTLTHPSAEIEKEYVVTTKTYLSKVHLNRCYEGIWDRTNQQLLKALSIKRLKQAIQYTPAPILTGDADTAEVDSDGEIALNTERSTSNDLDGSPDIKPDDSTTRIFGPNQYSIVLSQGHKREIRRMIAVQHENQVIALHRVRVGGLLLPHVPVGDFKVLNQHEVKQLLEPFDANRHLSPVDPNDATTNEYPTIHDISRYSLNNDPLDYLPRPMEQDRKHFSPISAKSVMPPLKDPYQLVLKKVPPKAPKRLGLVQNEPGTGTSNANRQVLRWELQQERSGVRDILDKGPPKPASTLDPRAAAFLQNRPQGFNQNQKGRSTDQPKRDINVGKFPYRDTNGRAMQPELVDGPKKPRFQRSDEKNNAFQQRQATFQKKHETASNLTENGNDPFAAKTSTHSDANPSTPVSSPPKHKFHQQSDQQQSSGGGFRNNNNPQHGSVKNNHDTFQQRDRPNFQQTDRNNFQQRDHDNFRPRENNFQRRDDNNGSFQRRDNNNNNFQRRDYNNNNSQRRDKNNNFQPQQHQPHSNNSGGNDFNSWNDASTHYSPVSQADPGLPPSPFEFSQYKNPATPRSSRTESYQHSSPPDNLPPPSVNSNFDDDLIATPQSRRPSHYQNTPGSNGAKRNFGANDNTHTSPTKQSFFQNDDQKQRGPNRNRGVNTGFDGDDFVWGSNNGNKH